MNFPHYACGEVVKGFGRGSKQLGIPTANYPEEIVEKLPQTFDQGVYYGWAQVENGPVYKMVMSIGKNPYYNNEKKTMVSSQFFYQRFIFLLNFNFMIKETYIMNEFSADFYGSTMKTIMLGHIRQMENYPNLGKIFSKFRFLSIVSIVFILKDALIKAIHNDIEKANVALDKPENQAYKTDNFFSNITSKI